MAAWSLYGRLLVLSMCLGGCKRGQEPAELHPSTPGVSVDRIKVGSFGPLSGPVAAWSDSLRGMDAYFSFINAKGGIHGREIELIYFDDQYDPSKTPGVVRRLVEKEEVFAIVGGIGTATGKSVADYLEDKGVPFFTPASGAQFWTSPGKTNVHTVYPSYDSEGRALAKYASESLGSTSVGVVYQDDDFGREGKSGLEASLAKRGAKLVVEATCLPSDTDMSGVISRILSAQPEVLVLFTGPKQAVLTVKGLHRLGAKPQIVTSFVLSSPVLFDMGGADWEGVLTSMAAKIPTSDDPAVVRYRQILSEYGDENLTVGGFTLSGFRFAMPFTEALFRAGPELTRASFERALETFDAWTGAGPYWEGEGLIGPVTFKGGRRLGHDRIFMAKAVDGRWVKQTDWMSGDD